MKLGVLLVLLTLLVAGCGELSGGGGQADTSKVKQRDFRAIVIQYNGRDLHCVEREGDSGLQNTSGAYSGLTCDWVRFHKEGP